MVLGTSLRGVVGGHSGGWGVAYSYNVYHLIVYSWYAAQEIGERRGDGSYLLVHP